MIFLRLGYSFCVGVGFGLDFWMALLFSFYSRVGWCDLFGSCGAIAIRVFWVDLVDCCASARGWRSCLVRWAGGLVVWCWVGCCGLFGLVCGAVDLRLGLFCSVGDFGCCVGCSILLGGLLIT